MFPVPRAAPLPRRAGATRSRARRPPPLRAELPRADGRSVTRRAGADDDKIVTLSHDTKKQPQMNADNFAGSENWTVDRSDAGPSASEGERPGRREHKRR